METIQNEKKKKDWKIKNEQNISDLWTPMAKHMNN